MKIYAAMPLRQYSGRVPNKNFNKIGSLDLWEYCATAIQNCKLIDKGFILCNEQTVRGTLLEKETTYTKLSVVERDVIQEQDKDATTEETVLSFLNDSTICGEDIIVLVQATSPLLTSVDLTRGLQMYKAMRYDSLLSVIYNRRHLWNECMNPINFTRSTRVLETSYMENGAFYIFTKEGLVQNQCRYYGNIGKYVMKESTMTELDTEDDLYYINYLVQKYWKGE